MEFRHRTFYGTTGTDSGVGSGFVRFFNGNFQHADRIFSSRIPNIPFFYLAYRGWSHWRGWSTLDFHKKTSWTDKFSQL